MGVGLIYTPKVQKAALKQLSVQKNKYMNRIDPDKDKEEMSNKLLFNGFSITDKTSDSASWPNQMVRGDFTNEVRRAHKKENYVDEHKYHGGRHNSNIYFI